MIPDKYQCQITYLLRDTLLILDTANIITFIQKYIKHKHDIFRRVAIYIINNKYDDLSSIFWDIDYNPIEDHNH